MSFRIKTTLPQCNSKYLSLSIFILYNIVDSSDAEGDEKIGDDVQERRPEDVAIVHCWV